MVSHPGVNACYEKEIAQIVSRRRHDNGSADLESGRERVGVVEEFLCLLLCSRGLQPAVRRTEVRLYTDARHTATSIHSV